MEDYKYLKEIESIDQNNEFLNYIINRVISDDYRGVQCSQHNRLTFEYFSKLIQAIYDVAKDNVFELHIGDDDGKRQTQAKIYYEVVQNISLIAGKGTINSVKKNTFPDIARMGFLDRYDKYGIKISENNQKCAIFSARLSNLGVKFVNSNAFERIKMFTDGVDKITNNIASQLVELLYLNDSGIDYIDILEFMYIVSDIRESITLNDKLMLILAYRKLNEFQKNKCNKLLKCFCDTKNRKSYNNKTLLRDYSNWKNESQQIYSLLSNSTYFKVEGTKLVLNVGTLGLFNPQFNRGERAKKDYFRMHGVVKTLGYELHHIIPFSKAKNKDDAIKLDDYKNLIYLKSNKHLEFSKSKNFYVILKYMQNNPNILFLDFEDNYILVNIKENALISEKELNNMLSYNRFLLKKFYFT